MDVFWVFERDYVISSVRFYSFFRGRKGVLRLDELMVLVLDQMNLVYYVG